MGFSLKSGLKSQVLFSFWTTKNVPILKTVSFWKSCRSILRVFSWNSAWDLILFFFNPKTGRKKHALPSIKDRYILWKLSFYNIKFSMNIGLKSHDFFLFFWTQNCLKTRCNYHIKLLRFEKNVCSIIRVFSWKLAWNLMFFSFFVQKSVKKHAVLSLKKHDVLWKLSVYYIGFSMTFGLKKLTFDLFLFWQKPV